MAWRVHSRWPRRGNRRARRDGRARRDKSARRARRARRDRRAGRRARGLEVKRGRTVNGGRRWRGRRNGRLLRSVAHRRWSARVDRRGRRHGPGVAVEVVDANRALDVRGRGDHRARRKLGRTRHVAERSVVFRIVRRNVERLSLPFHLAHEDRNQAVFFGHFARNAVEQLARKIDVIERHPRHAELQAERLRELCFAYPTALEQRMANLLAGHTRLRKDLVQLLARDDLCVDEELPDEVLSHAAILSRNGGVQNPQIRNVEGAQSA